MFDRALAKDNPMSHRQPIRAALILLSLAIATGSAAWAQSPAPSPPAAPGAVVWWDLLTEDPGAVLEFYRQLFAWDIAENTERHWVVSHHGRPIAGISRIRNDHPDVKEAFWLAGIAVSDVDAAVDRARTLGATVHVEPQDSAGYARFAVIGDPEGVPVMLLSPFRDLGVVRGPGGWVWAELWARDPDAEAEFYRQVVGYQHDRIDVAGGAYEVLTSGGQQRAGLLKVPSESIEPVWAPYLEVEDLQATLARAVELGGAVLVEPKQLHSVGSVALIADPARAAFFVYQRPRAAGVK